MHLIDHTVPAEGTYIKSVASATKPPVYTIDLSLPPSERYMQLATDYKQKIQGLPALFEDLVAATPVPLLLVTWLSRLVLRRLHSKEQTEEIRGISKITGVDIGGMRVWDEGSGGQSDVKHTKMLHFRTLDWGMDALREVIVQLEFVERPGGQVVARSITYVGFVGVITGIRKSLSVSLNFRPYHDDKTLKANISFYTNQVLVLLGLRPSIASRLRTYIVPEKLHIESSGERTVPTQATLSEIRDELPNAPTTAAYIIMCSGSDTTVMEKDHRNAQVYTSTSFITATNHDATDESNKSIPVLKNTKLNVAPGLQDLIDDSRDRKACITDKWRKALKSCRRRNRTATEDNFAVDMGQLIRWVQTYPTTNDSTHFACVMDPSEGDIVWVKQFEASLE
ncbi:hypothetical protein EJ05DRAFT_533404 [Pseudovirgaria hyperparasitica]|uniref:ceramidase n=1 Tax=Pseudovirgaria hyperparasitica TaxID=470096 RepID=A0A6A6VUV5_9PEZI|nr:uncharacterized protein EJ05DRAFT_533404 [Pseudovirgaria hyperparasitica]KAF2753945.1 hypothetical protein EJ05DRAFT_533404 [Pseudovirgaria hyperparasitica]